MRLPGYCTECHRIRQVRVSPSGLVKMQARGSHVAEGICMDCEDKQERKRRS